MIMAIRMVPGESDKLDEWVRAGWCLIAVAPVVGNVNAGTGAPPQTATLAHIAYLERPSA